VARTHGKQASTHARLRWTQNKMRVSGAAERKKTKKKKERGVWPLQ
jgi:hypothetical protein